MALGDPLKHVAAVGHDFREPRRHLEMPLLISFSDNHKHAAELDLGSVALIPATTREEIRTAVSEVVFDEERDWRAGYANRHRDVVPGMHQRRRLPPVWLPVAAGP